MSFLQRISTSQHYRIFSKRAIKERQSNEEVATFQFFSKAKNPLRYILYYWKIFRKNIFRSHTQYNWPKCSNANYETLILIQDQVKGTVIKPKLTNLHGFKFY